MKKILKTLALLTAVVLACLALYKMGSQVSGVLMRVNWAWIVFAVAGLSAYQWLNAGTWREVFTGLGLKLSRTAITRVWIQSESMKWLPGGIWGYGSRVVNVGKLGVDFRLASAGLAVELSLTVLAWACTALWILPTAVGQDLIARGWALASHSALLTCAAVAVTMGVGGCLICQPRVRAALGRILNRFAPSLKDLKLHPHAWVRAWLAYFGLCLVNGSLLWLVTLAVPGLSVPWASVIGIGGVAWLVGFFALGVPGGIGVREAALAGLLVWYGPMESAVAAAVVFRAAQVSAELIVLGISLLAGWKISRNSLAVRESAALS